MDEIVHSTKGSDARFRLLSAFAQRHMSSHSFIEYSGESKKRLAEDLASVVEQSSTSSFVPDRELAATLLVLRLLSREDVNMQALHNVKAVSWTLKLGGLDEDTPAPIANAEVIDEARKCLVNIIGKAEELTVEFVRLGGHWPCVKILNETLAALQAANGVTSQTSGAQVEKDGNTLKAFNEKFEQALVPVCRLLFTATRPLESNKPAITALRDKNLLDISAEFLFIYSFVIQKDPSIALRLYFQDLLRILVNLTLEHGALGTSDIATLATFIPRFPRLVRAAHRLFELRPTRAPTPNAPKDPIYNIHLLTASCLANVPSQVAGALFLEEDGGMPSAEAFVAQAVAVCQTLCDVLAYTMDAQEAERESPRTLAPLLMWITNLATGSPQIRPVFLKVLFPHRDVYTEETKDAITPAGNEFPCLGNRLIKLMTAIEHATKHFATELLYILVNEDVEMLVKLTGFGNAAGFLVERGMMGMGGLANQASTTREDIEAMTGKPLSRTNTTSKAAGSSSVPVGAGGARVVEIEDEEEEERKAKELMEKLEDMERRGLVKLVRKGEPMPEGAVPLQPRPKKDDDPDASSSVN